MGLWWKSDKATVHVRSDIISFRRCHSAYVVVSVGQGSVIAFPW